MKNVIVPINLPAYDPTRENFSDVGMEAFIAVNGGEDVTFKLPDHYEYAEWIGDWLSPRGEVYRLLIDNRTGVIDAWHVVVKFDLGEEITHGGEHVWSGAEWLAETRDMDKIRSDILADLPDGIDGEFITEVDLAPYEWV